MLTIEGFDLAQAMELVGDDEDLYLEILKEYYHMIDEKSAQIEENFNAQDWKNYTINVHALKSASRQVGAMDLGELAYSLELAGKEDNIALIKEKTAELLNWYRSLKELLAPFFPEKEKREGSQVAPDRVVMKELFEKMLIACDELDMDSMDEVVEALSDFAFEGEEAQKFALLAKAVESIDSEKIEQIIRDWE